MCIAHFMNPHLKNPLNANSSQRCYASDHINIYNVNIMAYKYVQAEMCKYAEHNVR